MDPVTAFGLLVNVATLIDLGVKVISIYKDGLGPNQTRLVESADEMEGLCQQLKSTKIISQPTASGSIEAELQDCVKRCIEKATALQKRLDLRLASRRQRALRSVRMQFSRKIPQLERDLQELRGELDTKLLVSIRENINLNALKQTERFKSLELSVQTALVRFCHSQSTALDLVLDRNTRQILDRINEVQKTHIENEAKKDIQQRRSRILESLLYGSPFTRENDIESKHDGTFEWIFDEGAATGSAFLSWLRSSADGCIFWIQSKPGSGKSTLMKFLCTSMDRIEQSLHLSATAKRPVFFSFYFWLADSAKLQNTERGLLCSLLCQFLETTWTLESSYLSDVRLRKRKTQGNWDLAELRSLLFLAADTLLRDHSVCIFVDALDECLVEDQVKVLRLVKQLSSRGVKICLSSRPEQGLVNKLAPGATEILKVDLYTKDDIERFINDEFDAVDLSPGTISPSGLSFLASEITKQAEGVFLWATLVAKDVRKGVENGDDFDQLRSRVDQTPGDLDSLYENMLSRLGPDQHLYMAEAGSYFSLALHSESCNGVLRFGQIGDLPLIHCLSTYKRYQRGMPHDQQQNLDLLLPRVATRIHVVCAGMLDCVSSLRNCSSSLDSYSSLYCIGPPGPPQRHRTARFIHRTARDFFLESNNQVTRSGSLSLCEYYHAATSGFLMAYKSYYLNSNEASYHCFNAINDISKSKLQPPEQVKLLLYLDMSMQEIYHTKHWLYRQCKVGRFEINSLDVLGTALLCGRDPGLLDSFLQNGAPLSPRYKAYLLLNACTNAGTCSHTIQHLLLAGADPNQVMFSSYIGGSRFKARASPWLEYLAKCCCPDIDLDRAVVQAFLDSGADLQATTLWHAPITDRFVTIDSEWGIQYTFPDQNINLDLILLANARYVAEALLRSSLQPMSATELPAPYCKVLGFISMPPSEVGDLCNDYIQYSGEYSRPNNEPLLYFVDEGLLPNADHSLVAPGAHTAMPKPSLSRVLCAIQHSLPQGPCLNYELLVDEFAEYIKHAKSTRMLAWALDNGYLTRETDPAAVFPDFEKFRGQDGYIDIDALFAG